MIYKYLLQFWRYLSLLFSGTDELISLDASSPETLDIFIKYYMLQLYEIYI